MNRSRLLRRAIGAAVGLLVGLGLGLGAFVSLGGSLTAVPAGSHASSTVADQVVDTAATAGPDDIVWY